MRQLVWKPEKNEWLKRERGISFEIIEEAIASGGLKGVLVNRFHPDQIILAVALSGRIVAVPTSIKPRTIFFRTAYFSRKLQKQYKGK